MGLDWVRVDGKSMYPFLQPGELIGIRWLKTKEKLNLKLGDLVLGRSEDQTWVVHRVIRLIYNDRIEPFPYWIKGDRAIVKDELSKYQVWGKVIGIQIKNHQTPFFFKPNSLDRCIAILSRMSISSSPVGRVAKKLTPLLSRMRRKLL